MKILDKLYAKAGRERIPLAGSFELLPMCNLSCKMCYVRKSAEEVKALGGLLAKETWLEIAKNATKEGMLNLLLTGGEPFLYPDFQEILEKTMSMGLQVSINTNGTMIDEKMAKWLRVHRPVRMNITLYGASEDTYQSLCGNGEAYERMRNAVQWLKENEIPVKFNTSITPHNVHDLAKMIAFAKEQGSLIQVATYMFPPVRRDSAMVGKNDRLSPEEAAKAKVEADYLQSDPKWFLSQAERLSHFVPLTDEMLQKQAKLDGHEMTCRAGRCTFWVDWQGRMGNCGMYSAEKYSLKQYTVAEAWEKVVRDTNEIKYSAVCTNCPNFRICHSCISMVYNETGDIHGRPEYICKMTEASAKYYKEYVEKYF